MRFDQHPTRNYFIAGNGKTMTIKDHGVFYEYGATGGKHRNPKRAIIKPTAKNKTASSVNISGDWVRLPTFFWTTTAAVFCRT